MLRFKLSDDDRIEDFETGLGTLGRIDVATRHENRFRDTFLLGRAYAFAEMGGCTRPLVILWRARIDIPASQRQNPLTGAIERSINQLCGECGGIVQRDIRTEARSIAKADVKKLVQEDIERGDLPNRLLFNQGLQHSLYNMIGKLYRNVGDDPNFDWHQVKVTFE